MLSNVLYGLGRKVLLRRFPAPSWYWESRVWDGYRAECDPVLGPIYREQRTRVAELLDANLDPTVCRRNLRAIDVACGTGRYTQMLLAAGIGSITCLDISKESLRVLTSSVRSPSVRTVHADVHAPLDPVFLRSGFEVVLCCDAIHHLGHLPTVLTRLVHMRASNGLLVGDIWTSDHYYELQRMRQQSRHQLRQAVAFAAAACVNSLCNRPLMTSARSQLHTSAEVESCLRQTLGRDIQIQVGRYWVTFAWR